jgi:hypothetical protein
MLKTVTISGKEVEKVDVLKTSPLAIFKAPAPGSGYVLAHLGLERVILTARTQALAKAARKELGVLDFDNLETCAAEIREAQKRYLDL